MLGQNKHSFARRKHPSIPRCDEWTRSLSVCRRSVGMTTPRHERKGCLVMTVNLDTVSMVPSDVVDLYFQYVTGVFIR